MHLACFRDYYLKLVPNFNTSLESSFYLESRFSLGSQNAFLLTSGLREENTEKCSWYERGWPVLHQCLDCASDCMEAGLVLCHDVLFSKDTQPGLFHRLCLEKFECKVGSNLRAT